MNHLKRLLVVLFCVVTSASAADNSRVLDSNARPIQDLAIIVGMGTLPQTDYFSAETRARYSNELKEALEHRLPDIFVANGVPVRSTRVTATMDFDEPWGDANTEVGPSHYLVLNAYKFTSGEFMSFEATLWNAREQKKVWKAFPSLPLGVNQPLLRTQLMAADLLKALRDDRMLTLSHAIPVDLAGEPIKSYFIWAKDR